MTLKKLFSSWYFDGCGCKYVFHEALSRIFHRNRSNFLFFFHTPHPYWELPYLRGATAVRIVRELPTNMRNSGWNFSPGAGEMPSGQRGRKKSYCCLFIPLTATRSSPTLGEQLPCGLSERCEPLQKNVTSNCSTPCPKNMLHQSMMSITSP